MVSHFELKLKAETDRDNDKEVILLDEEDDAILE